MRIPLSFIALVCCGCLSAAETDPPLAEFAAKLKVPGVAAAKLKDFKLDAAPNLAAWSGPLNFSPLSGVGDVPAAVKTAGYLAADLECLYLAIRCVEPEMAAVKAAEVPLDGDVWQADNVEFMVLPGLEITTPYYQFAVNPAGSLYDARVNDKTWNSSTKTKVFKDEAGWTAVLAVPFKDFGLTAEQLPALWRVNLHRSRPKRAGVGELDLAWSPTLSRSNHVPSRFGLVLLPWVPFDAEAVRAALERSAKLEVLFRQTFEKDTAGFSAGEAVKLPESPSGSCLRLAGKATTLERNPGNISGLKMALAYRTPGDVTGLVVQGGGTIVRACRPGLVEVLGRGLKVAQQTCRDADGQSSAADLGCDAFLFKRPYGH